MEIWWRFLEIWWRVLKIWWRFLSGRWRVLEKRWRLVIGVYNYFRCDFKCDFILGVPAPKQALEIRQLSVGCKTCDLFLD